MNERSAGFFSVVDGRGAGGETRLIAGDGRIGPMDGIFALLTLLAAFASLPLLTAFFMVKLTEREQRQISLLAGDRDVSTNG